jgi:hypothetical protein
MAGLTPRQTVIVSEVLRDRPDARLEYRDGQPFLVHETENEFFEADLKNCSSRLIKKPIR